MSTKCFFAYKCVIVLWPKLSSQSQSDASLLALETGILQLVTSCVVPFPADTALCVVAIRQELAQAAVQCQIRHGGDLRRL